MGFFGLIFALVLIGLFVYGGMSVEMCILCGLLFFIIIREE